MKIVIGAGGTGGHLYPALALVEYIKEQNPEAEFLFVGTLDRLESKVVPKMGYEYKGLDVKGFVGNPIQKLKNGLIFLKSIKKSKQILREFQPDIVIGFGGYPSASIVMAASKMHIPTMIHEQNSVIGLTNKVLIKRVDKIICCYQKAYDEFPKEKTLLLGNPRASAVVLNELKNVRKDYNISNEKKMALIVMGSLGSKTVNDAVIEMIKQYEIDYEIIFVTGKNDYDRVMSQVKKTPNVHIKKYIDDLPSHIYSCDLLVTRAGATTLAELTALQAASLIIPSPYVVKNHQEYNARELVDENAAQMILEKDLSAQHLYEKMDALIHDDEQLQLLKKNAKTLAKVNASSDMYHEILKLTKRS